MDARILHAMGRGGARDRIIAPVFIGGRVVNLLYADNGPGETRAASMTTLENLASRLALALEILLLRKKLLS